MKECDIVNNAVESIIAEAEGNQTEADIIVDSNIQVDPDHKSLPQTRIFKKLMQWSLKRKAKQVKANEPAIRKAFGELSDREYLAGKIRMLISSMPQLSEAIVEELFLQVTAMDLKLAKLPFEIDKTTGQPKLHLYRLPVKPLTRLLSNVEAWTAADPDKFDSWWYKNIRLPWGTTRKIRFTENSGAYHNVWKATQSFADRQGFHIDKFMKREEGKRGDKVEYFIANKKTGKIEKKKRKIREYGMEDILQSVQNLYWSIPETDRLAWEKDGFFAGRSQLQGESHIMELFTWMMHGRIEHVDEKRVKTMTKGTKEKPSELVYKHGPGMYIYTANAPTSKSHETTGDVVFGWQKPVPLKYDSEIHGTEENMKIFDHNGNERYDTLKLIKDAPPLSDALIQELLEQVERARPILDESHGWFNHHTDASFRSILRALIKHFPNKSMSDLQRAFGDGKFTNEVGQPNWSIEEKKKYTLLEENFTKWSLQAPFKPTSDLAMYKKNYFPYDYMPERYTFLLQDAIDSLDLEIDRANSAYAVAKGEDKQTLAKKLKALRASRANQIAMKEQMIEMDVDDSGEGKMVTRIQSKHFKHITNALDVFKSRTDMGVTRNSFEHSARTVERNNLTASLIESLDMTEHQGVRDAFISLYRGALGRRDARSLMFGKDMSDINMNPKVVRTLKAVRKYWNLMLAKPATSLRQMFGHLEKYNKAGPANMSEAFALLSANKQEYERIFQESGIIVFNDFFTNSIVKELEKLEADRDTINAMTREYVSFFLNRNKGMSQDKAADRLKDRLTKLFGRPMKWENVLTEAEALQFTKKLKAQKLQRITNKITSWSINNQKQLRQVFRETPGLSKKLATGAVDLTTYIRGMIGAGAVMSEMEGILRKTSFILGVRNAQRKGLIPNKPIYELRGKDRVMAIDLGRKATNILYDFSLSRQGVGEAYRGSLGSIISQFTVWQSQKAASDIDVITYAAKALNRDTTPTSILKAIKNALPLVGKSIAELERTDPDGLALRRWLTGQFALEFFMQALMISPFLPALLGQGLGGLLRKGAFITGARNMSAAGSPIAGLIWGPIILSLYMAVRDDPWDDEQEMERFISNQVRNLPGFGTGAGLGYDITALVAALILEQENMAIEKASRMTNYAFPQVPGIKEATETILKEVAGP